MFFIPGSYQEKIIRRAKEKGTVEKETQRIRKRNQKTAQGCQEKIHPVNARRN